MKHLKVLLVNAVLNKSDRVFPPLGLCYIASALRQDKSTNYAFKLVNKDYAKEIATFAPDVVFISSVSKNYSVAKECARLAKSSGASVVVGGVHVSTMPQTITGDMDVAVIGEGEATIREIMANFYRGQGFDKAALRGVGGLAYWNNGSLVTTGQNELLDLDAIPYPARDLITVAGAGHMMTGRGCPFHCAFCSTSHYMRNIIRQASAEYVAGEMKEIYRNYGVSIITIYDDLFAMNTERVAKIQQALAGKNLLGKFRLALNMRADMVTDGLAEIFKAMGVVYVGLGLESGCQATLQYLKGPRAKLEDGVNAIRILQKHKIGVYGSFIIGSPYEDRQAVRETASFIEKNKIRHFGVGILTPFPNTPVWEYALSRGLVSEDMDWSRLNFDHKRNPVILSEKLSRAELGQLQTQFNRTSLKNEILSCIPDIARSPSFYWQRAYRWALRTVGK